MQLNKIELTDKKIFDRYLASRQSMSCEYSFLNLYCWQDSCCTRWSEYENRLFVWYTAEALMLMPIGEFYSPAELTEILNNWAEPNSNWSIYDVPQEYLDRYPETSELFVISENEDDFDYIYETEKLVNFSGKKLRKKRNLIKQFYDKYPDYKIIPLSNDTHDDCLKLTSEINHALPDLAAELQALERFFAGFDELHGSGTAIYVANELIGFSVVGQLNNETNCEHFEKVNHDYKGAAQLLVNETAKQLEDDIKYLNREQDMGMPGLRRTKRSYDQTFILKRYQLRQRKR